MTRSHEDQIDTCATVLSEANDTYCALEEMETAGTIDAFDYSGCGCFSEWSGYCGGQTAVAILIDGKWSILECWDRATFTVEAYNAVKQ